MRLGTHSNLSILTTLILDKCDPQLADVERLMNRTLDF